MSRHGYCPDCNVWSKAENYQFNKTGIVFCHKCKRHLKPLYKSEVRREMFRILGFRNYKEYLASEFWAAIRERAFEKHGTICHKCGKTATQLHHIFYDWDTLIGRNLGNLVPICASCHHFIEFHPDGNKTRRQTANKKLDGTYKPRSRPTRKERWDRLR